MYLFKIIAVSVCLIMISHSAFADDIDAFLRDKMKEMDIPGLQIAVVKNDKIIKSASYGIANIQNMVAVDNETVFNLASITKAFTSVAVMQLVEHGKVILNSAISNYIEDLPQSWQQITVNQLLSHTSGLPNIMNQHFQLIDSDGEEQSWKALLQKELLFTPGSAFHYNQTNYLLIGRIIKRVSGKSYSTLIKKHQLNKVSMNKTVDAGFAHFENVNVHQARDYRKNKQEQLTNVLTYFPTIIRAGAGMSSNAKELANWAIALQNGAFFEDENSLSKLWKVPPLTSNDWAKKNPNMHPYALGWYLVNRPLNKKIVSAGGGQSAIAVYPDDDLSIILLTNLAGSNPEGLMDELAEFYLENFGLTANIKLLKSILQKNNYEQIIKTASALSNSQNIIFDANELHHFGELLNKQGKTKQATQVFNLNNQLFSKLNLATQSLDEFIGEYKLEGFTINVSKNGNALFITATNDATLPIFSVSHSRFILKAVEASITFKKDENARINGLILNLNDQDLFGKKLR